MYSRSTLNHKNAWVPCVRLRVQKNMCCRTPVRPEWKLYISLAAFSENRFDCRRRMKIPLLFNKWLIVLLSHPHWREVITGPYESEMSESIRGWMGGHGPGAPRGARTRKLITWYWWRTSTPTSLSLPLLPLPVFVESEWHRSVKQVQFSSQVIFRNSRKSHIWRPLVERSTLWGKQTHGAWMHKAVLARHRSHLCGSKSNPFFEYYCGLAIN